MANDHEQARHDAALAKRQAEKDKVEQSAEAFQSALKKVFKNVLKDEDLRSKIHDETQNGKRGLGQNPEMDRMARASQNSNGRGMFTDLDDVETGFEPRYWEKDES